MRVQCHLVICASTVLCVLGNLSNLVALAKPLFDSAEGSISKDSSVADLRQSNNDTCPDECKEGQTCKVNIRMTWCPSGCKCVCLSGYCKRVSDETLASAEFKWDMRSAAKRVGTSCEFLLSSLKQVNDDEVSADALLEAIKTALSREYMRHREIFWISEFVKYYLNETGLRISTVKYVMISVLKIIQKLANNLDSITYVNMGRLAKAIEDLSSMKIVEGEAVDAALKPMQTMSDLVGESSKSKMLAESIKAIFDMNDQDIVALFIGYLTLVKRLMTWGSLKPITRSTLETLTTEGYKALTRSVV